MDKPYNSRRYTGTWGNLEEVERFERELLSILAMPGAVAKEISWDAMARAVARHFRALSINQSPLSTFHMLKECGEMLLKIRIAEQRSGKADQEELERWLAELMGPAVVEALPADGVMPLVDEDEDT